MTDTRTDPLAHVKKGDPDCNEYLDDDDLYCKSQTGVFGFECTRPRGHVGQHIAGTGFEVAAVWTDEA